MDFKMADTSGAGCFEIPSYKSTMIRYENNGYPDAKKENNEDPEKEGPEKMDKILRRVTIIDYILIRITLLYMLLRSKK